MRMKSLIYKLLSISNDINAIQKGKVSQRLKRRAAGKIAGRIMRRL